MYDVLGIIKMMVALIASGQQPIGGILLLLIQYVFFGRYPF